MIKKLASASHWEERYRLIIQFSKQLPRPTEQDLNQMHSISGCEAKLWFGFNQQDSGVFLFQAYSEARIINGLFWILLQEINGKTAQQLANFNLIHYFSDLGITQRLSTTRLNGLKQIETIIQNLVKKQH